MIIVGLALVCDAVFIAQTCSSGFIGLATKTNRALAVGLYVMVYNIGGSVGSAAPGPVWKIVRVAGRGGSHRDGAGVDDAARVAAVAGAEALRHWCFAINSI